MRIEAQSARHRLPWAALAAIVLVLAADGWGLRWHGPWKAIADQAGAYDLQSYRRGLDFGIAHDRQQLEAIARTAEGVRRVLVVGSSRIGVGFDERHAEEVAPEIAFGKIGHAGLDVFAFRSMVDALIAVDPEVIVLLLSEYDTHRPLRLEPMPGKGAASLSAFAEVVASTPTGFLFENRQTAYRLVASTILEAYRYRRVLVRTQLRHLYEFRLPDRLTGRAADASTALREERHAPTSYWDAKRVSVPPRKREAIFAAFEGRHRLGDMGLALINETRQGDHARVQLGLLVRALDRLEATGVDVVILEGPAHPAGAVVVPAATTREFRAFAEAMARRPGVSFVPLVDQPRYPAEQFMDLLHLEAEGATRFTEEIVRVSREAIDGRPG